MFIVIPNIAMEFLLSFLRRHFVGKPVASQNVGCFLGLRLALLKTSLKILPVRTLPGALKLDERAYYLKLNKIMGRIAPWDGRSFYWL